MEGSLYTIRGLLILDNDGERILCKYYDDAYPTLKEQRNFEKSLFKKTHRANSEIIMFDGITCIYRSNIDLFFYIFGSTDENELILSTVLSAYYDSISMILRDVVEKATLLDNLDALLLIADELIDGGVIMETDPYTLAQCVYSQSKKDHQGLSDQNLSNAINSAGAMMRRLAQNN
eukprot:UC4_evm4s179